MSDQEYRQLHEQAVAAGRKAAEAAIPTPMVVYERVNPFDDSSAIKTMYPPVMEGPCGFAWVNIRDARKGFARWAKQAGVGRHDSYEGGVTIWVSAYGQSMQRKEAHAYAYAGGVARGRDQGVCFVPDGLREGSVSGERGKEAEG